MPTLRDIVLQARAAGESDDAIMSQFKARFGDDLGSLDADTDYDAYKKRKGIPVYGPEQDPEERGAKETADLLLAASSLPRALTAPGPPEAAVDLPVDRMAGRDENAPPSLASQKPRGRIPPQKTFGQSVSEQAALVSGVLGLPDYEAGAAAMRRGDVVEGLKLSLGQAPPDLERAFKGGRQAEQEALKQKRKQSGPQNLRAEMAEFVEGPAALLALPFRPVPEAEALPYPQSVDAARKAGRQIGEDLVGGMTGGTAAQAEAFLDDPWELFHARPLTVLTTAIPGAKAVRGGIGRLESAGGRLGKVAAGAGKTLDVAAQAPGKVAQVAETAVQKAARWPGDVQFQKRLDDLVARGALTPGEAAQALEEARPKLPHLSTPAEEVGRGSGMLKGAAAGSIVLGDFIGAVPAAILGAAAPMVVERLAELIPPDKLATLRRWMVDRAAQKDAATEDAVRTMLESNHEAADVWHRTLDDAAEMVRRGEVVLNPGGETVEAPTVKSGVWTADAEGRLVAPADKEAARVELADVAADVRGDRAATPVIAKAGETAQFAGDLAMSDKAGDLLKSPPPDVQAGLIQETPRRVPFQTLNPRFESLVDEAHKAINVHGGEIPRHWVARAFTDTLLPDTLTLLRSQRARGDVYNRAAEAMGVPKGPAREKFMSELDDRLFKDVAAQALGEDPEAIVLQLPGAKELRLSDLTAEFAARLQKTPEGRKQLADSRAEAIRKLGLAHRQQILEETFKRSLRQDLKRFEPPDLDQPDARLTLTHMMQRTAGGEPMPIVVGHDVQTLARQMLGNPQEMANLAGVPVEQAVAFAERLLNDFEPADGHLKAALGADDLFIQKGPHESLKSTAEQIHWSRQLMQGERDIERMVKRNLTTRNLPVHITNISQNTGLMAVTEGRSPVTILGDVLGAGDRAVHAFKRKDVPDRQLWSDLRDAGLGGGDQLEIELGTLGKGNPPQGKVKALLHHLGVAADETYRLGDLAFKSYVAEKHYKRHLDAVERLENGRYYTMELGHDRIAKVQRMADGTLYLDGKPVKDDAQLRKAIAKSAMKVANDFFFNYADVPLWNEKVRAMKGIGAGSPFFTYFSKAIDLPGKRGLLGHMLAQDGALGSVTDSPRILSENAGKALALAGRRAVAINGMRAAIDQDPEGASQMLAYMPREMAAMHVLPAADPGNVWMNSWTNNSFAATDLAFRIGLSGLAQIMDPKELLNPDAQVDERTRRMRSFWRQFEAGEMISPGDFVKVLGVGAPLLFDTLSEFDRAEREGTPFKFGKIASDFARMFFGGTPAAMAVQIPFGAGRRTEQDAYGPKAEDWKRYLLRALTGIGYRKAFVDGAADKYLQRVEKQYTAGLQQHTDAQIDMLAAEAARARGEAQPNAQDAVDAKMQAVQQARDTGALLKSVMKEDAARTQRYMELLDSKRPQK